MELNTTSLYLIYNNDKDLEEKIRIIKDPVSNTVSSHLILISFCLTVDLILSGVFFSPSSHLAGSI